MIKSMTKKMNNKKGFTLIELIVVIAILGILAAIAVPRLTGFQETARLRSDVNNAKLIANSASIAIADGKTVTNGITLADTNLTGYIEQWPTVQGAPAGTFTLVVGANDAISVTNGTVEVYPNTHATFKP